MGARRGQEYVDGLRDDRELYVNGELVRDVTTYPAFQGVIREMARLYDCQHREPYTDILTYPSPTSNEPVSTSFVLAESWADIEKRRFGETTRCELTCGMMGRLPDYMNAFVADSRVQMEGESGDLKAAMAAGTYDRAKVTELKEVVAGRAPGRSGADEITLFKSVGTAIQDVAAGFAVYKEAVRQGLGQDVGEFLELKTF